MKDSCCGAQAPANKMKLLSSLKGEIVIEADFLYFTVNFPSFLRKLMETKPPLI